MGGTVALATATATINGNSGSAFNCAYKEAIAWKMSCGPGFWTSYCNGPKSTDYDCPPTEEVLFLEVLTRQSWKYHRTTGLLRPAGQITPN